MVINVNINQFQLIGINKNMLPMSFNLLKLEIPLCLSKVGIGFFRIIFWSELDVNQIISLSEINVSFVMTFVETNV